MTDAHPRSAAIGGLRVGRRSVIAAAAAGALLQGTRPAHATIVNNCVIGRDGWLFAAWDEIRHSEASKVHRVTATLNEAIAALKAAKVEVAVSLTPSKSRIYREFLPDDYKWSPEAEKRYALAADDLRHAGTVVPDQATALLDARKQKPDQLLFFKADTHWTGEGAEIAAQLVAREIKAKVALPASAKPGTKLAPAAPVTQERNDLAALLPPGETSKYPFQSYMLRKPFADTGAGLLADDAPDVLVMGNSYMQPVYGFASIVSEQLNRPVELQWKVHQFSPYFNMLNLVRSDRFKKQKPRLIVWDFEESDMETPADNPGAWGQSAMPVSAFLSGLHGALSA